MKASLLYGIDRYGSSPLMGCVDDAQRMAKLLSRHSNGDPNFECRERYAPLDSMDTVTVDIIRDDLDWVFGNKPDTLLFYFSGHGANDDLGTLLACQDGCYPLRDLVARFNNALRSGNVKKEAIIILDCCFSGGAGHTPVVKENTAVIAEGLTILAATRPDQPGIATSGGSVFTNLLVEALDGGAADLLGQVTLSSAYAFVDIRLGAFDQRPMFKCHISSFSELRKCEEGIARAMLRNMVRYFIDVYTEYALDPSYEEDKRDATPEKQERNKQNEAIFAEFRKLASLGLLEPVGEKYLYWAAVKSKACRLTSLGRHYWQLVKAGRV